MRCPFCNIDKKKNRVLRIGRYVAVILSNPRLVDGHLLIIPIRHVEKISDLSTEEKSELWETVTEFQEKILNLFAKGCDIRQNYRPFQREDKVKINHLHVHLQPREFEDELYKKCQIFEKKIFRDLTEKEAKKFLKLFSD